MDPLRGLTTALLSLLILSTLLGNALVCAAVLRFRHLRSKVTNVFVFSLAVSDLLVALLVMPWRAAAQAAGYWPFGAFCDVWVAFDITCSTASILHLCLISLDRYWAISSPFRYERRMTRAAALATIGVAWLLSLLISFIPVRLRWHRAGERLRPAGGEGANGTVRAENCDASLNRTYAVSSSLVSFYIPVVVMVVTYGRIYRIAHHQLRRISALERAGGLGRGGAFGAPLPTTLSSPRSSLRKETKVLKTLSVIVGVFVGCWLPFFVLNCLVPFCPLGPAGRPPCVSETTFSVFVWCGWANSALNPVVYAFNGEFRRAFASVLGRGPCAGPSRAAVETLDLSDQLVSYRRDTGTRPKEPADAYVSMIPF
ncbi:D(1B) dopamine receptor-like, partial [Ornithorhynchus anatinus]|uniref:D(1B) dopamine receptor-like n=1 Tax=Ornithorhynchus anatinus TaxID=9258 RepID=UPI0010A914C9